MIRRCILLFLLALIVPPLFACGGGGGGTTSSSQGSNGSGAGSNGGGSGGNPGGNSQVDVSISPNTITMGVGDSQAFTATVTGSTNTAVNWNLTEGATAGTLSGNGVYTASFTPGTYHLVATSQASHGTSATATIMVQSGSGAIRIQ
jgi:chitinase